MKAPLDNAIVAIRKSGYCNHRRAAYDFALLVPVFIDNVHAPELPRPNALGIDVDADYREFIGKTCRAYTARYHM